MSGIKVFESNAKIRIAMMFKKNPARIMSFILIIPLEKTMAFGGVEMGIIKA